MLLYANDHQGHYPDTIGELVEEDFPTSIFICPSSNDVPALAGATPRATAANIHAGRHLSYIYVAKGMTDKVAANIVLVYEPLTNHQNKGLNVLFGDLHVDFYSVKEATWMLSELKAGHNPPRDPRLVVKP